MFTRIVAVSVLAALSGVATAQTTAKSAPQGEKAAAKAAPSKSQAHFDQLKKMAGVWQGEADKDGNRSTAIYRVTSGGSAVAETLMPGTEHEMISLYTLDGDTIVMTHYCAIGNQPRMRSKGGTPSNVIAFDFQDVTGMKSDKDGHMHSLVLTFNDDDHVAAAWQYYVDGKPSAEHATTFSLSRVKDADAAAKIITTAATSCCVKDGAACCESGVKATGKN